MRRTTIIERDKQLLFDAACTVADELGFDLLYTDRIHLEIEAMKAVRLGKKRHLSVRIIPFRGHELEVNIEIRNLGLELRRNKRNDLLEARFERAMVSYLKGRKSAISAA
jgi:hypothetical protein